MAAADADDDGDGDVVMQPPQSATVAPRRALPAAEGQKADALRDQVDDDDDDGDDDDDFSNSSDYNYNNGGEAQQPDAALLGEEVPDEEFLDRSAHALAAHAARYVGANRRLIAGGLRRERAATRASQILARGLALAVFFVL